jgi:glycosyltransferase involved in cell wall biosynthesis
MKFDVLLIGRKLPRSLSLSRNYATSRMKLFFNSGFLFYAEYNLRLFFKLLFAKKDILLSNDLDTLLPNFLISKFFNKKLVYDSHELFIEIPELIDRPKVKKIWLFIENYIFPKLKNIYTVNNSIAEYYSQKYNVNVKVVRNIAPILVDITTNADLSREIKGDKKMLIIQGTGININRGAEEAIEMMQYLEDVVLFIIGGGDVFNKLKELVFEYNLADKVIFKDKVKYKELIEYTKIADLGLSLDKGTNLNYEYSLPNKIFDYIQAQTPLMVSNRKEVAALVNSENIGMVLNTYDPQTMAMHVHDIFSNQTLYKTWKENLLKASKKYSWEVEQVKVKEIFQNLN